MACAYGFQGDRKSTADTQLPVQQILVSHLYDKCPKSVQILHVTSSVDVFSFLVKELFTGLKQLVKRVLPYVSILWKSPGLISFSWLFALNPQILPGNCRDHPQVPHLPSAQLFYT